MEQEGGMSVLFEGMNIPQDREITLQIDENCDMINKSER